MWFGGSSDKALDVAVDHTDVYLTWGEPLEQVKEKIDAVRAALDALTRIEMQNLLARVWLKQRFTAVLVTHDVSEAVALADRILLIEDGGLALDIPVDLPRPRQRGSVDLARLEERLLRRLLKTEKQAPRQNKRT